MDGCAVSVRLEVECILCAKIKDQVCEYWLGLGINSYEYYRYLFN